VISDFRFPISAFAMHLLVLIHGILTRRTSASWPKHFTAHLQGVPRVATEALYYEAGPFPWSNTLLKNPRLARDVAGRVWLRRQAQRELRVHFVAHSNGADIAVRAMRRLASEGIRTETAVLTGAAIHSDVDRSGLRELILAGALGRAYSYSSPDDLAVRRLETLPGGYGALGARGFRRAGEPTGLRVEGRQPLGDDWGTDRHRFVTRWFPGFGHGEYFDADERLETFACVLGDCGV
jgi:hypothetical protein